MPTEDPATPPATPKLTPYRAAERVPAGRTAVRETLAREGLAPSKRYGQSFLVDGSLARAIVRDALPAGADAPASPVVIEVGPGLGMLTAALLDAGARVVAVEIDAGLVRFLRSAIGDHPRLTLIHADVLAHANGGRSPCGLCPELLEALAVLDGAGQADGPPLRVVANLPYSISTALLMTLAQCAAGPLPRLLDAVAMVQAEVADRMTADPGSPNYGLLTLGLRARATVTRLRSVPRDVFEPRPRVTSTVVRVAFTHPYVEQFRDPALAAAFERVARALFQYRRKRLARALVTAGVSPTIESAEQAATRAHIDPNLRGETLDVPEVLAIARAVP